MIYEVHHTTRIRYAAPVADARFNLRLEPVAWPGQTVADFAFDIAPTPSRRTQRNGPYHVATTRLEFDNAMAELKVDSRFRVTVTPADLLGSGPLLADLRQQALAVPDISVLSPAPYLVPSRIAVSDKEIGRWAEGCCSANMPILDGTRALASRMHEEFTFKAGVTDSTTAPRDAFAARHGVCQDFAHIMIMGLRWLGIPAAYASGYLRTLPPPGQDKLVGADAMHAWVNVWCGEELGWVGVDPTNDCLAREDHVQIGMGRDYADVAPIDGTFVGSSPQAMDSGVEVRAIEPAD